MPDDIKLPHFCTQIIDNIIVGEFDVMVDGKTRKSPFFDYNTNLFNSGMRTHADKTDARYALKAAYAAALQNALTGEPIHPKQDLETVWKNIPEHLRTFARGGITDPAELAKLDKAGIDDYARSLKPAPEKPKKSATQRLKKKSIEPQAPLNERFTAKEAVKKSGKDKPGKSREL